MITIVQQCGHLRTWVPLNLNSYMAGDSKVRISKARNSLPTACTFKCLLSSVSVIWVLVGMNQEGELGKGEGRGHIFNCFACFVLFHECIFTQQAQYHSLTSDICHQMSNISLLARTKSQNKIMCYIIMNRVVDLWLFWDLI